MEILFLLGFSLIVWAIVNSWKYLKAKKWHKTQGKLIEVTHGSFQELNLYSSPTVFSYPSATYTYTINNKPYKNNIVTFERNNLFKIKNIDKSFWDEWKAGDNIEVYYNPSNHTESALVPNMSKKRRSHYLALVVAGLLIITVGLITTKA